MKRSILILILAALSFPLAAVTSGSSKGSHDPVHSPDDGLEKSKALVSVINQYRREQGLFEIPFSANLTYVARWHVWDLEINKPDQAVCNAHSWSNQSSTSSFIAEHSLSWSPCCYTPDHAQAKCMWDKPKEITKGAYGGNGFEIAYGYGDQVTTYGALEGWKGSPEHLSVIINRGKWADHQWKAVGAAMSSHYAVVWFGEETDGSPASAPTNATVTSNADCDGSASGYSHVLKDKDGKLKPECGYTWANSDPGDYRVRRIGESNSENENEPTSPASSSQCEGTPTAHSHVIRGSNGQLKPECGYNWLNFDPHDYRVRLMEGLIKTETGLRPASGYEWVNDEPKDFRVRLMRGLVRTASGTLLPDKGYRWVKPNDPDDLRVEPIP